LSFQHLALASRGILDIQFGLTPRVVGPRLGELWLGIFKLRLADEPP